MSGRTVGPNRRLRRYEVQSPDYTVYRKLGGELLVARLWTSLAAEKLPHVAT